MRHAKQKNKTKIKKNARIMSICVIIEGKKHEYYLHFTKLSVFEFVI